MTEMATVHVVEDDASFRVALVRLLRAVGFQARAYASADEFLLAERNNLPECLLLDVGLPRLSGVELIIPTRARARRDSRKSAKLSHLVSVYTRGSRSTPTDNPPNRICSVRETDRKSVV